MQLADPTEPGLAEARRKRDLETERLKLLRRLIAQDWAEWQNR